MLRLGGARATKRSSVKIYLLLELDSLTSVRIYVYRIARLGLQLFFPAWKEKGTGVIRRKIKVGRVYRVTNTVLKKKKRITNEEAVCNDLSRELAGNVEFFRYRLFDKKARATR